MFNLLFQGEKRLEESLIATERSMAICSSARSLGNSIMRLSGPSFTSSMLFSLTSLQSSGLQLWSDSYKLRTVDVFCGFYGASVLIFFRY